MSKTATFLIRMTPEEKGAWEAKALEEGKTLSRWIRERCLAAVLCPTIGNAMVDEESVHPIRTPMGYWLYPNE